MIKYNKLFALVKKYTHRIIAHLVARILKTGATYDANNFRLWEKQGYHITPVSFYYPIPDTRELTKIHPRSHKISGIDFRPEFQLQFLAEIVPQYASEYNAFPLTKPASPQKFYIENDAFVGIDPHLYHVMIRHFQPRTIIEVGAGNTTLLGAQASRLNGHTRYISIEPYPRDFIAQGVSGVEHVQHKAEDLPVDFFRQLRANDILFIDSSHVIKSSGDVCFLILNVLPCLEPGVIVHFHDIYLPFDYSRNLLLNIQYFWTEQYLLQAYLADNDHAELLIGSKFILDKYPTKVKNTFPQVRDYGGSASFWIRKC
ncbi:class I SAM-dependent methyltransferase [Anaerolineales bacterium HSG6]|nr:class I SAM-dependent methyltransferase [Anaerolineales bacterium HSG6]